MTVFSTLNSQQRQNLLLLFIVGILFWASHSSLIATLPLYIRDIGGTPQQVGFVMGTFALGLILSRPWLGNLADRRSRKIVVLMGLAIAALSPLGYFINSILLLLPIRAFHGISLACYAPGNNTLIVDWSPVHQRGQVIGYMSLSNPIGMSIGPVIGSFLQEQVGYTPLFLFSVGLGLLGFLFASRIKEPSILYQKEKQNTDFTSPHISIDNPKNQFWKLLDSPRIRIPTFVLLLIGLIHGAVTTFIPLYLKETEFNLSVGWFYAATAVSSFGLRWFTGYGSYRHGWGLFITVSLVCYILGTVLLSQAQNTLTFLLAGFFEGAGGGTLIPLMLALISDRSHPQERGRVFSLCVGGFDVGLAIAGPVFGAFARHLGYQGIFLLTLGFSLLALTIFTTLNGESLHHSLRFAAGLAPDSYALDKKYIN